MSLMGSVRVPVLGSLFSYGSFLNLRMRLPFVSEASRLLLQVFTFPIQGCCSAGILHAHFSFMLGCPQEA